MVTFHIFNCNESRQELTCSYNRFSTHRHYNNVYTYHIFNKNDQCILKMEISLLKGYYKCLSI